MTQESSNMLPVNLVEGDGSQTLSDTEANPENSVRRSQRTSKLALKARENKVLELSQIAVKAIDKQLEMNERFLEKANEQSIEDVETFLSSLEAATQAIRGTVDEMSVLDTNKDHVNTVSSLFEQYLNDVKLVHEYYNQRKEQEGDDLHQAELAVEEAKTRLDEEVRRLEARMEARRARLAQRVSISPRSPAASQPSNSLAAPLLPQLQASSATILQLDTRQQNPSVIQGGENLITLSPQYAPAPANIELQNHTLQSAEIAQSITDHMHISLVAPPEPSVFSGDPLQYADWRVSFDNLIDSKKGTPMEKLHRLKKYVSGDAKEAISGYFRLQTADAYKESLEILHEEFGRDDLVENGFRDKLEGWPKIASKDQVALKRYWYFLKQCLAAQKAIPNLRVLDDKRENKKFVKVLPAWLVNRWSYVVTDQEEKGSFPPFSKYVDFVRREAKVSTNTIREADDSKPSHKPPPAKEKTVRTLSTHTKQRESCLYCSKGIHPTTECRSLTAKSEEDKTAFVKEQRLCFGCLKPGHQSKFCSNRSVCNTCKKNHPTALHKSRPSDQKTEDKQDKQEDKQESRTNAKSVSVNAVKQDAGGLLSMIVPVYISVDQGKDHLVYALLDNQSDATFISAELAAQMRPRFTTERITLTTLNGQVTKSVNKHQLNIRGYRSDQQIKIQAYQQDNIPCHRSQIPNRNHIADFPHLEGLLQELPPKMDIPVAVLIGVDCAQLLAPLDTILGQDDEPFAIKTALGWTLCGGVGAARQTVVHNTRLDRNDAFHDNDDQRKISQDDLKFLNILEKGFTKTNDGSCCLPLPFKEEPVLPDNKAQAERRYQQLQLKFQKNEAYKQEYTKFMDEMIKNGHAEIAAKEKRDGKVWYIPHFGVFHPKKKKIRVVFDGSASYANRSLNEELLGGPDQMNSLVGILLRFRRERIGISCDIEKMFHNFHVQEDHRDFLRFIWLNQEYRMTRHLFGAKSSPGVTTFALRKVAQSHDDKPSASQFIINDFYVDDGITSTSTAEDAVKLIHDTIEICSEANLRLHKFVSNERSVLATLPASEIATNMQDIDLFKDKMPLERTLGLEWCVETDTIKFQNSMTMKPPTRRGILSVVSQLYDPLGLLAPFTLRGKRISQKACQEKGDWDQEVTPALKGEWMEWTKELNSLDLVQIKRCVKKDKDIIRTEIHHFSDASLDGYGACSYLRTVNKDNQVHVALLMAKSRVTPLKPITVPRLELQAAVEAVRLSVILKAELCMEIDREFFWCDSTVTLGYIKNSEARYYMFVANRVQEIRDNSDITQWYHVPGKLNPADTLSRGSTLMDLQLSAWWEGPKFLHSLDINQQVEDEPDYTESLADDPEVKRSKKVLTAKATIEESAMRFEDFGTWASLIRAVATAKMIIQQKSWKKPILSATDLREAELTIIRMEQSKTYDSKVTSKQSPIFKLNPFIDEAGLLRVGGRARKSLALSYDEKHPLIVPKSHIAKLLAQHVHQQVHHQGQTTTLGAIRGSGYWIIGASKLVKDIIYHCIQCKKIRGKPMVQLMGELPQDRVQPSPPFTHVGIDCFGPFTVKDRRTEVKRWGLIITCMYSRAIHIETLDSMTSDAFINALRCFVCIRGSVTTIYCDNGTNFVGADNELYRELSSTSGKLRKYLDNNKITFKYNTPNASHAGGVWERQIRTIRSVLSGMSQKFNGRLDTASLRAALYEAMATVNSRPLSTNNLNDPIEVVLTPNHLITMKPRTTAPAPGVFDAEEIYGRKMWRKVQQFGDEFWKQWKAGYLSNITKRQRWTDKRPNLQKGDLVLLMEDNQPRNQWQTAVVEETTPGDDDLVRKVKIKLSDTGLDKNGKRVTNPVMLDRPIQKLILLSPTQN